MNNYRINETSNIILGLDIGISSIGFALVDKGNHYKIIKAGIRLFDAPEDNKKKVSLQSERGGFRRGRNAKKNEFKRTKKIIRCLITHNLLDEHTINTIPDSRKIENLPKRKSRHIFYIKTSDYLFYKQSDAQDVLTLRAKALEEKINDIDFARVLYSFNKHRGITYDDIKETTNTKAKLTSDQKKLKEGIEKYNKEYNSDECESVGVFLYEHYKNKFRNTHLEKGKDAKGKKIKIPDYMFSIPRSDLKDEIELIFEKQKALNNPKATDEFRDEYINHFLWEEESPSYENLVSPCFYNPDEKSASKHHFYACLYIAVEKLHNLRFNDNTKLTMEQIKTILNNSFKHQKGVSYEKIKTILNMKETNFKGIIDEKLIVVNFEAFIKIKKILMFDFAIDFHCEQDIKNNDFINNDLKDIINIFAHIPNNQKKETLQELNLNDEIISELLEKIKIKGHLRYSLDVLKKLCFHMLDGLTPDKAQKKIEEEYGTKHIKKLPYLPPIADIDFPMKTNHGVVRALSQVRAVINDILKYYRKETGNQHWTFDSVVIELAREMNTKKHQKNINKEIKKNTKSNREAKEFCEKHAIHDPSYKQLLKAKLFIMQNGVDPYAMAQNDDNNNLDTLGKIIPSRLFDESYCEIEHILPISRSLDDSQSNKVLVLTRSNQNKGNKTPYEWLKKEQFEKFETFLRKEKTYKRYGFARVRKLLNKDFQGVEDFKPRDIINTQIISKYTGLYIDNHLQFWDNPNFKDKQRVFANNGRITSILRKSWAIGKKNRDNHLHHGEDAILIACSTPALIKNISTVIAEQTELSTGELSWDKFHRILKNHQKLKKIILQDFEENNINIDGLDISDNQIQKDFISYIFRIIARDNYPYEDFGKDFKDAVKNAPVTHFVKHKKSNAIHKENPSKIEPNTKINVKIREGTADKGGFVRYDVFMIENTKGEITYDFVNLTASYQNTKTEDLPNPTTKENETASFMFSVYKNDLLEYTLNDGSIIKGNFRKVDSSIYIDEPKNQENTLFSKQIKKIQTTFSKTDDVIGEDIKKILDNKNIEKALNLERNRIIETQKQKIKTWCDNTSKIIKETYHRDSMFIMQEMYSVQTIQLRTELIEAGVVLGEIERDPERINPIYVYLSASGYVPSERQDGQKKLINLKKIQTNCLGEETTITKEERKTL